MANDNVWKPTAKQTAFLQLPYTVLEAFYAGAVHAGKTDVLLLYPIIHRLHEIQKFKALFLRRTFPELKNEVIPRSTYLFRKLGAKYNKNDKVWEFPSGALFFFGHCENEDDVHNYDSMQVNYAAFDELTSFTEWQYLYITLQRVRSVKDSGIPAIVRSASNPGNVGHAWVKKRFIDPWPEGMKLIKGRTGITRIYIPATVYDNPHTDPNYLKSLEAIPDRAEREAKLFGKWDAYEGQVFDEFRDRKYPEEPDNALHVVEPFDIPQWWPKINVTDWGFTAMTYSLFGAISPNRRVYLYRELSWRKTKIEEWGSILKEYLDRDDPKIVKLCKSAGQDTGQEHTIHQQVSDALGRSVELTKNTPGSRIAGKLLLHEYLRWRPRNIPQRDIGEYDDEQAQWLFRNKGVHEFKIYVDSFKPPPPEDNLPKLLMFNCPLLITAIKSCVYDKPKDNRPAEDVMMFDGDDPYDTVRYLIDAADRFFDESTREFELVQEQQKLLVKLKSDNDWTMFYRNMHRIEADNAERPVNRYRH